MTGDMEAPSYPALMISNSGIGRKQFLGSMGMIHLSMLAKIHSYEYWKFVDLVDVHLELRDALEHYRQDVHFLSMRHLAVVRALNPHH